MSNIFSFKQFDIIQDHAAMKIGTDAVLLGAWIKLNNAQTILDIGSGTGILSLQLAQRTIKATIDAIDIEISAYRESRLNFKNSPWTDRLNAYHYSIDEYEMNTIKKHDLIICNPPFFSNSYKPIQINRAIARHNEELDFNNLLRKVELLLTVNGEAGFIIPYDRFEYFITIAKANRLYPYRITHVQGIKTAKPKRSLIQLSRNMDHEITIEHLVIEISRHRYTQAYISLVKDFYLKM